MLSMRINKKIMFAVAFIVFALSLQAQQNQMPQSKTEPIMQIFGNFHTGFGDMSSDIGFDLERAYLGALHHLSDGLTIKGVIDMGRSADVADYHRIAYIKNAMISWGTGDFTFNGGLIPTTKFSVQEKFWGFRHVMKSFQDLYKFGSSADLGLSASWNPNEWLSADVIVVNGEGYKKIQSNAGFNYGIGATIALLKGLQIRIYGGINQKAGTNNQDLLNLAAFMGYKIKNLALGAEYNYIQTGLKTSSSAKEGLSAYVSFALSQNVKTFARFDQLNTENIEQDESTAIVGAEFKIKEKIKLAPNFRIAIPKQSDLQNRYFAYVNCSVGL